MIIFGTPGLVRMRNFRAGFPGSETCPYWCFEVKLQEIPDSNCELGGDTPWESTPQTISYMAWQPGLHYINQDLSVRAHGHAACQLFLSPNLLTRRLRRGCLRQAQSKFDLDCRCKDGYAYHSPDPDCSLQLRWS